MTTIPEEVHLKEQKMRIFDTGATRDDDKEKLDYDGFLSPLVIKRYAEYLHKHRVQADGNWRDSDNWQKGIPLTTYMKSLWRHFVDLWTLHRSDNRAWQDMEVALCAIIFNASGYLHELEKSKQRREVSIKDISARNLDLGPQGKLYSSLPRELTSGGDES